VTINRSTINAAAINAAAEDRYPEGPLSFTEDADQIQFLGAHGVVGVLDFLEGYDGHSASATIGKLRLTEADDEIVIYGEFRPRIPPPRGDATAIYTLILTGAADSLPDILLSCSSFQARRRSASPSYLQVVVPTLAQLADIEARPNGQIVITAQLRFPGGAETDPQEISRVNFETLRYDEGARSSSLTLTGFRQQTFAAPQLVPVPRLMIRSVNNGRHRVRVPVNFAVRPLDTVELPDGGRFAVGEITYIVSPALAYMELSEVAA
jgi:hypothetical protein